MKKKLFTMMIPLMVLLLVFGIGCKQAASGPSKDSFCTIFKETIQKEHV